MGPRRAQSGFSAIWILLFLAAVGGGLYFAFGPRSGPSADRGAGNKSLFDDAVAALERALADPQSMQASLERNAAFQCLFSGKGACGGQGGPFLLFESAQSPRALSHLGKSEGSGSDGSACRSYPSRDCVLHVETSWEPVCGGGACEDTRSFHVRAKITLMGSEGEAPRIWEKEALFSPDLHLSLAMQCARSGGTWSGVECLSADAAERRVASAEESPRDTALPVVGDSRANEENAGGPAARYECPNTIVVQGQYYPVQFLSADRAQVSTPSMSCQQPGHYDTFVFQCAQKTPAAFPMEGQWIQVEAVMDPPCDQNGGAIPGADNLPVRF